MRQQRNKFQTKEQDKTPEEQLREVNISNLLGGKFQSNDSKDDPGSQKKNGGTDEEDTRNV